MVPYRVEQGSPVTAAIQPALRTALREQFLAASDLRGFVERHRGRIGDPEIAFYVSQALEECVLARDLAPGTDSPQLAFAGRCRGFDGERIAGQAIMELLRHAASHGEPHAIARMLLFRDVAAPKDEVLDALPWMLTSHEASILRDVGAFLSRGEVHWRYGGEPVPVAIAALAWELAACDLDARCRGPVEAAGGFEPPEALARAQALRAGIARAIRDRDWEWIGIPAPAAAPT